MTKRRHFALFSLIATLLVAGSAPQDAHANGRSNSFKVEIDGVNAGGFTEVSGLESEIEIIEYRNGDDPITRKRPGRTKYSNITLKRGYIATNDRSLLDWYLATQQGKGERKSGSIISVGRDGTEVLRYNFFECWPTRHAVKSVLDSNTGETKLVEEMEFAVERSELAVERVEQAK